MKKKSKDDEPETSDSTNAERHQLAQSAISDLINRARAETVREPAETDEQQTPSERVAAALNELSRSAGDVVSQILSAEADAFKARLRAQAEWYKVKLETARIAAATRLEHKAVEVEATCNAKFDLKLKDMSESGGSVEAALMERIEEQEAELKRLQRFEPWLTEAREEVAQKEAELEQKVQENAQLKEDARVSSGVMARAVKTELGLELKSVAAGGSIREVASEFVAAFGNVKALTKERDDLKLAIEEKTAELEVERTEKEKAMQGKAEAEAAAAIAAVELAAAKEAEQAALERLATLERELSDLQAKLSNAEERIRTLEAAVEVCSARINATSTPCEHFANALVTSPDAVVER